MGAWGYRAYDNDEALDWLDEIEDSIIAKIEAAIKQNSPHTIVAAASLLIDLDRRPLDLSYTAYRKGLFNKTQDALQRLLTEPVPKRRKIGNRTREAVTWVETLNNPELAKQMLSSLIERLKFAALEEKAHQQHMRVIVKKGRSPGRQLRKGSKGPGERNRRCRSPEQMKGGLYGSLGLPSLRER